MSTAIASPRPDSSRPDSPRPASLRLVARLGLARKFALLGAIALVVVGALLALHVRDSLSTLRTVGRELDGLEPSRALLDVVRLAQQHRGLTSTVLGGKADAEPDRAARQAEVDAAMQRFDAIVAREVDDARTREDWSKVSDAWRTLSGAVAGRRIAAADSLARHTALIAAQIELHDRVVDHFALTLHPEAAGYFMIVATLQQMPRLTELMGQARARGAAILAARSATPEAKAALAGVTARVATQLRDVRVTLDKAFDASPDARRALGDAVDKAVVQAQSALELARTEILEAGELRFPAGDYFKATTAAIDAVYGLADLARGSLRAELEANRRALLTREATLLGGLAAMLAFGAWIGVAVSRSIVRSAGAARDAARRIADGDLTGTVPTGGADEMGELLESMARMQASIARVVGEVHTNADSVASASSQIAQGNQDLSQRTEEQASALEQTAATMEELGTTVRQNADNARQASRRAEDARGVAAEGGQVVGRVVETMKGISESSRRIADIIGVIDGIAFQTNILALNAAVEAARAGDQGRGFAVVAGEVRTLAQRSADAAREIKALITTSVSRVEQGTALVDDAGRTMDDVVRSIARVTEVVGEISAASVQQASGVDQVGDAVAQMDRVTQQNAALVEQSAAAAESLKHQAATLVQAVGAFRLAGAAANR